MNFSIEKEKDGSLATFAFIEKERPLVGYVPASKALYLKDINFV